MVAVAIRDISVRNVFCLCFTFAISFGMFKVLKLKFRSRKSEEIENGYAKRPLGAPWGPIWDLSELRIANRRIPYTNACVHTVNARVRSFGSSVCRHGARDGLSRGLAMPPVVVRVPEKIN